MPYKALIFYIMIGNLLLMIAGWKHPEEANIASYVMRLFISSTYTFSCWWLKSSMALGYAFIIGNIFLLSTTLIRGGHTINIGAVETIGLFSILISMLIFSTYGAITKKWDGRILLCGTITSDVLSFYPQYKQYLDPNDPPSYFLLLGLLVWALAMLHNIVLVQKTVQRIRLGNEKVSKVLLDAAISVENFVLLLLAIYIMSG